MTEADIAALSAWIAEAGLAGAPETTLLEGFCERARGHGLPLARGLRSSTLCIPLYEGRDLPLGSGAGRT